MRMLLFVVAVDVDCIMKQVNVRSDVCFVRCHCKQIGAYTSVVRFDLMIVRVLLVSMGPFWYQTVAWYGFVVAICTAFVGL